MEPSGTIVFSTVGRTQYGFDIFSVDLNSPPPLSEHRLTDGLSVNFNGSFSDSQNLIFISERTGSPKIHSTPLKPGSPKPAPSLLPSAPNSLFHDRPILQNHRLYFISAHEPAQSPLKSWSALYSTTLQTRDCITRLTPKGFVDFSPALSQSGDLIAVASYGSAPWAGDFQHLETRIEVFRVSDPEKRVVVANRGGWPTWSGDSTVYFHRVSEDGWWSVYSVELPEDFDFSGRVEFDSDPPRRVTQPGLHAFTPAAFHDGKRIAVATRRKGSPHRHVEIFDLESEQFESVTEKLNPNLHHYNPFVSSDSKYLGYHRFRGESESESTRTIPNLEPVTSPVNGLKLIRINGTFPSFSPDGDLIAYNSSLIVDGGIAIVKSDGSKRWNLFNKRTTFCNSWSPVEKNVIFTSIGPIFQQPKTTVQIARVTFDLTSGDAELKILTKEETGNNAFPACSPDGKHLVFRSGRSGHKNLYILDAVNGEFEGGSVRQLTFGACIDTMPNWSPDGKLIAFSSNRHSSENDAVFSIYLIHPDGTGLRRVHVADKGDVDRERINHVYFSPDSKWLLFASNLGGVTAEPVSMPNQFQPYGDLYVVRLDGSDLRRLTCNTYENGTPVWVPADLEAGIGRLCLDGGENAGECDKLAGEFIEPLWITTDF